MEDASLEDFLDRDGEEEIPSGTDTESIEQRATTESSGASSAVEESAATDDSNGQVQAVNTAKERVTPAAKTSQWVPRPEPCPICGDHAQRFWFENDSRRCGRCTNWQ